MADTPRPGPRSVRMSAGEYLTFRMAATRNRQSLGEFLREAAHDAAAELLETLEAVPGPPAPKKRGRPPKPR